MAKKRIFGSYNKSQVLNGINLIQALMINMKVSGVLNTSVTTLNCGFDSYEKKFFSKKNQIFEKKKKNFFLKIFHKKMKILMKI